MYPPNAASGALGRKAVGGSLGRSRNSCVGGSGAGSGLVVARDGLTLCAILRASIRRPKPSTRAAGGAAHPKITRQISLRRTIGRGFPSCSRTVSGGDLQALPRAGQRTPSKLCRFGAQSGRCCCRCRPPLAICRPMPAAVRWTREALFKSRAGCGVQQTSRGREWQGSGRLQRGGARTLHSDTTPHERSRPAKIGHRRI